MLPVDVTGVIVISANDDAGACRVVRRRRTSATNATITIAATATFIHGKGRRSGIAAVVAGALPAAGRAATLPEPGAALAAGHELLLAAAPRDESVSRFNRFKSSRSSAAVWYRSSRSFSSALPMISSSFGGTAGF